MATEIRLPALAPSMSEGTLSRWLKKPGDEVKAGDPIAEIETDKALVEMEAAESGVLAEILVKDGTAGVKVGSVIALLSQAGETGMSAAAREAMPPPVQASPAVALISSGDTAPALAEMSSAAAASRTFASPVARRLAREHDLELASLAGSGPRGRIVRVDIERALKTRTARTAAPAPAVVSMLTPASRPAPENAVPAGEWDDIPHTPMRRVIAQRLAEAKRDIPHYYLTVDCRVEALLDLRKQINEVMPDNGKVSVNDFIIKAVALALKKVPAINASWMENAIRRYRSVDVCVAVATQGGLITPIVRNADQKSLGAMSSEIKGLAERARSGRLSPQEYQGGGFTVSNLGMYGVREFAAIINPPQSGILAVGAAELRPVVKDGALGIANVMTCTLSADHRVADGSVGAEFLAAFKDFIEKPHAILV